MTRPLSNDLRERVLGVIQAGESCRSAGSRFGIAASTVVKWSQRYRATGSLLPGKMGEHRRRFLELHRAFIVERLRETPHLTLQGLKDELSGRGVKVSHDAVSRFPAALGAAVQKNAVRP